MSYYRGVDDAEWETEYTSKRGKKADDEEAEPRYEEDEDEKVVEKPAKTRTSRPRFRFMTTDQTQILRLMKKTGVESFYNMEIKEDKGYTSVTAHNDSDFEKIVEYLSSKGKLHYIYVK